jgi:hypothetical protein
MTFDPSRSYVPFSPELEECVTRVDLEDRL